VHATQQNDKVKNEMETHKVYKKENIFNNHEQLFLLLLSPHLKRAISNNSGTKSEYLESRV